MLIPNVRAIKTYLADQTLREYWKQVAAGDKVWLGDTVDAHVRVGRGTVMSLGGSGLFHNRPIPPEYVRVNLEEVLVDLPLMIPVEAAAANSHDTRFNSILIS